MTKSTAALESSQAKLEAEQKQLKAEREWLTEQQRTLTNDQTTLAAWRSDQVRWVVVLAPCYQIVIVLRLTVWKPSTLDNPMTMQPWPLGAVTRCVWLHCLTPSYENANQVPCPCLSAVHPCLCWADGCRLGLGFLTLNLNPKQVSSHHMMLSRSPPCKEELRGWCQNRLLYCLPGSVCVKTYCCRNPTMAVRV